MAKFIENKLEFDFSPALHVIKYDESEWHRRNFGHRPALDFLLSNGQQHWWIEVKDCINFEIQNQFRLSGDAPSEVEKTSDWIAQQGWSEIVKAQRKKPWIVEEIFEKFRSTAVGIALARRVASTNFEPYLEWSCAEGLTVLLLLTWDSREYKRLAERLRARLDQHFQKFNIKTMVVNEHDFSSFIPCAITRVP